MMAIMANELLFFPNPYLLITNHKSNAIFCSS